MIHADRARAGSFGADAQRYDLTRPRYPQQLVDDLVAGERLSVLDVGCGTGIAAEGFVAAGCDVLGVEPDPRMAAVAAAKGLAVETGTFEDWAGGGRRFDLVISGQAWHWVDPETGPAKAASVLRPGGRLAVFWNLGRHEPQAQEALDGAYERQVPALRHTVVALGRIERGDGDAEAIRASGLFAEPEVRHYEWTARYTSAEWVALLPTHSDHRLLEPDVLAALLDDVAGVIDGLGGELTVHYDTVLVTAVRT